MSNDLFRLIISASVWGYIFIRYMDIIYTRKYSCSVWYGLYWVLFVIIAVSSNLIDVPFINSIVIYLLFIAGASLLYIEKGKAFVLYNSFFMLFMIFLEIVSVVLFTYIIPIEIDSVLNNGLYMNITDIPVLILGIILYPLIAKLFRRQKISEITFWENILVVLLLVLQLSIISYVSDASENYNNNFILLIIISFIIFDIIFLKVFRYTSTLYEYKKRNSLLEQQNLMSAHYYQEAENNYKKSRKVSHDINRHLEVLKGMIEEADNEDAIQYINGVEAHLQYSKFDLHFQNRILNLLLNQKYQECISKKIKLKLYVQDLELNYIDEYDITTILGNLIDNAIDESVRVEDEPFIEVRLFEFNNILNILVKNKSINRKTLDVKIGFSTKENHDGYGLLNVKEAVEHYCGRMKIVSQNGIFCVSISIPFA